MTRIGGTISTVDAGMAPCTKVRMCGMNIPFCPHNRSELACGLAHLYLSAVGQLELITWEWTDREYGQRTGWGNVIVEEAEEHKRMFEVECRGKKRLKSLFFKKWPQAFRWTCCGTDAGMNYGCDHHGSGSRPCTCDFCQ